MAVEDTTLVAHLVEGRVQPLEPVVSRTELSLVRGKLVHRYLILDRLGAGGMGVVYSAYDPQLDRKIALKVLHPQIRGQSDSESRLVREARAMAKLSHANVVTVHDVGTIDGRVFVAMEFIDGKTLGEWIEDERPNRQRVVAAFLAAARGLAAAHGAGLVHRDFKPDNVMIAADGRVKVMDFGLARTSVDRDDAGESMIADAQRSAAPATPSTDGAGVSVRETPGAQAHDSSRATVPRGTPTRIEADLTPPAPMDVHAVALQDTSRSAGQRGSEPGALPLDAAAAHASQAGLGASRSATSGPEDVDLTKTGAILGTPAYMAPEQHSRGKVDARSDQFSFCVALYEALYGERPFRGDNLNALSFAVLSGEIAEAPRGTDVPASLRRVVVRGLARDPAARWPDMDALVRALEHDPRRRSGWVIGALGLAAVAAIALGLAIGRTGRDERCAGSDRHLVGVWDAQRKSDVAAAFAALGVEFATQTFERTIGPDLDAYAAAWISAHRDACEDTMVRRELSSDVMDRRMRCLEERKRALAALSQVLSDADVGVAQRAAQAVASLPAIERCAELEWVMAQVEPAADEATRAQTETIDAQLATADAQRLAGRPASAVELARAALERADGLGYPPIVARARLGLGRALIEAGEPIAARVELERAWDGFLSVRDDAGAAETAVALTHLMGPRMTLYEEARRWAGHAEAMLARTRAIETPLHARLLAARGTAELGLGEQDAAEGLFRRALELRTRLLEPDHPDLSESYSQLGMLAFARGQYEESRQWHEKTRAHRIESLGPAHPSVASCENNIATTLHQLERIDEADAHYLESIRILEAALGTEHPDVATVRNNRAALLSASGRIDDAMREYDRVLAVRSRALGDDHLDTLATIEDIGIGHHRRGHLDAAERAIRKVFERRERLLGPDHPDTARALANLANVVHDRGRIDDAVQLARDAVARAERGLGRSHLETVRAIGILSILELAAGDAAAAERYGREYAEGMRAHLGADSEEAHEALGMLFEALWARGQHDAALEVLGPPAVLTAPTDIAPPETAPPRAVDVQLFNELRRACAWAELGRRKEAAEHAERTLAQLSASGSPRWRFRALVRIRLARLAEAGVRLPSERRWLAQLDAWTESDEERAEHREMLERMSRGSR